MKADGERESKEEREKERTSGDDDDDDALYKMNWLVYKVQNE